MKITLLVIGHTNTNYIKDGIEEYLGRVNHYNAFEIKVIRDIKNAKNFSSEARKKKEGQHILNYSKNRNEIVLLDEGGKSETSQGFARYLQKKMASGLKELVFVIGGPYGFSDEVHKTVKEKLSLSEMTFPHELAQLIFMEQLYRAFTILKGESYHHQ